MNDGPAGAAGFVTFSTGRSPAALNQGPVDKGRKDLPEEVDNRKAYQRIEPGVTQIRSDPTDNADRGGWGLEISIFFRG